jgi:hypothetical protein
VLRRLVLVCAVVLGLGACSDSPDSDGAGPWRVPEVSVDAVRLAAAKAGPAPKDCPLGVDVPATLRAAGVDQQAKLDTAEATASKTDKPAADPIAAQQGGMSAIDATAGAEIACYYTLGDDKVDVYLVAIRVKGAAALLAPIIARDAHVKLPDLPKYVAPPPGPGEIKIAADSVAVCGLRANGGDAAMVVSSTSAKVHGDTLRSVAGALVSSVMF